MSRERHTVYLDTEKLERLESELDATSASHAVRMAIDIALDERAKRVEISEDDIEQLYTMLNTLEAIEGDIQDIKQGML